MGPALEVVLIIVIIGLGVVVQAVFMRHRLAVAQLRTALAELAAEQLAAAIDLAMRRQANATVLADIEAIEIAEEARVPIEIAFEAIDIVRGWQQA